MLTPLSPARVVSVETPLSLDQPPEAVEEEVDYFGVHGSKVTERPARSRLQYIKTVWIDIACIAMVAIFILPVLYMPILFPEQRLIPMRPPVVALGDHNMDDLSEFGLPPALSFPKRPELLPTWACGLIVILGPIGIISLFQIKIRSLWDFHAGTAGILKAVVATTFIQVLLKQFMGGARPHFVDVCKPDLSILSKALSDRQLFFDISACTADNSNINVALQSFPSGHTANSFAVALFLALYMNAKLKPFADYGADFWAYMVTILPLLCASLISGSMFISHQHHAHDIIFGIILGLLMGTLSFRSSYAAILDFRYNHIPLPPMSTRTRLSYKPQTSDEVAVAYLQNTGHLQVWDWWKASDRSTNYHKQTLWLQHTRCLGHQRLKENPGDLSEIWREERERQIEQSCTPLPDASTPQALVDKFLHTLETEELG
ncbi:pap2 superfamily protein [Phlyctema vagabunda]|uniref:Pap2 superfamily protein n=1 Tax=Phlyctema vagabunda TaxID=108571 RepID=A0ABR4PR42_9HELO